MRVTVTSAGLDELHAVLESAADDAVPEGRKVVARGALQIKNDWRRRWSGSGYAPNLAYTVTYDTRSNGTTASAEIGPDKAKQVGGGPKRTPGNLGHIYEYGIPGTAPRPGGRPALDAEEPRFVAAVENLGVDLLEGQ